MIDVFVKRMGVFVLGRGCYWHIGRAWGVPTVWLQDDPARLVLFRGPLVRCRYQARQVDWCSRGFLAAVTGHSVILWMLLWLVRVLGGCGPLAILAARLVKCLFDRCSWIGWCIAG